MLAIFWDESHIWGLLAARAMRGMGVAHRLVRGADIANGLLAAERPAMLMVPGGNARHKAEALGESGIAAIREYVASGGQYLGFCGGAGLALTWQGGLGLCPWTRASYDDRMQHFMSGHLHTALPAALLQKAPHSLAPSTKKLSLLPPSFPTHPLLPVWWPGRFEARENSDITVLATYEKPGEDFWLADLPIASLPPDTFSTWQDVYGISLSPTFLTGQPCLIHGAFGQGGYTISYSHLETPQSPHANLWLAHLLESLAGIVPTRKEVPAWIVYNSPQSTTDANASTRSTEKALPPQWDDPDLLHLQALMRDILNTGLAHGLLFQRTPWLMGWRAGIPGANLNNLWAALASLQERPPTPAARAYWNAHRTSIMETATLFHTGGVAYLLAERLALTLAKTLPDTVPAALLKNQRAALFGPPMQAGGLYRDLMQPLDELAFLQIQ